MKKLKEKLNAKLSKNSGFTLVEMLIVVAIIAILVAVSIPVLNNSLDDAKKATDDANIRAATGAATVEYLRATEKHGTGVLIGTDGTGTNPIYYVIDKGQGSFAGEKPTDAKELYKVQYGKYYNPGTCVEVKVDADGTVHADFPTPTGG